MHDCIDLTPRARYTRCGCHELSPLNSVELLVKSTTERAQRWKATGSTTRIILTGENNPHEENE